MDRVYQKCWAEFTVGQIHMYRILSIPQNPPVSSPCVVIHKLTTWNLQTDLTLPKDFFELGLSEDFGAIDVFRIIIVLITTSHVPMNGTVLKQVHKFNYLGSLITSDGRCINEIKRRMAQAKASFQNMKSILMNKRLSLGVRKRVLQCYIEPILLYVCESWSMTKQTSTSIEAMEMWLLRRMLRVSWTEKRTNLEILNSASSTRKLMSNIKRRQA